jgi:hypothetical protein
MRRSTREHLHALDGHGVDVVYLNVADRVPRWIRLLDYDAVVLHPNFLWSRVEPHFEGYARRVSWLSRRDCVKLAVPQDEFDHAHLLDSWLDEFGVSHVFSNFDPLQQALLYPRLRTRAKFIEVLTGYIDEGLAAYCDKHARPLADRSKHVVYRAYQLPYWNGSHGQLKYQIGEVVAERAAVHGLEVDISTRQEDTIYGDAWAEFLLSGRAVLGSESGSSVLDRHGEVQARIRTLLSREPDLSFDEVNARMPRGWDSYVFFAIGPRHLEAVVTRTCQVLVRGRYSGVLEADRHYLPLERDFSNLDAQLERLHDVGMLQATADRAYEEIFLAGKCRMESFSRALLDAMTRSRPHSLRRAASPKIAAVGRAFASQSPRRRGPLRPQLARTRILLRAVVSQPALIGALLRAAATGRLRPRDSRLVLKDLLRLSLMETAQRTSGGLWRIRARRVDATLILASVAAEEATTTRVDTETHFDRVVWDYSAVGESVPISPGNPWLGHAFLGDGGRYEFRALQELAARGVHVPWDRILAPYVDPPDAVTRRRR